jgi:hypothetical protein
VLLNPMLWFQFVSNAHNDLVAVCLLAGAIALVVRRYHPLAALLVAAAGLVKFPFMIVGAVVFERLGPRRALLYAAGAAGLCVLLSALFGGRPYLDALLDTGRLTDAATAPLMKYAKVTIALSTLGIVAFVVFRRRFPSFGGFVFPAIAPTFYPWYLLWALPYALAARRFALPTLVALPLLGTLADGIYGYHGFSLLVPAAALGWVVWSAAPGARGSTPSGSNAVL